MKIRPANIEDALPMAHVIVDTFLAANQGLMSAQALQRRKEQWTYEASARDWQETMQAIAQGSSPYTCLFVAEDDGGEVIGFAMGCASKDKDAPQDVGEIDILYVRESHQRRGIGRALAQAAAAHLADVGMTKLHICTPEASTQARRFYDGLGGRVIATRDDYDDGELIVLVVYEWRDIRLFADLGKQDDASNSG